MRSFLLLTSLLALALGFAGTALGVRPRPVAADAGAATERIQALELRMKVLTEALEDLEGRFDDHRARTPVLPAPIPPREEPAPAPDAGASAASPLLVAALERAEDHVQAGDSRGARDLFREILSRPDLPVSLRVRARIGVAAAWEAIEAWSEVRRELEGLAAEIEAMGADAPAGVLREVRGKLERGVGGE